MRYGLLLLLLIGLPSLATAGIYQSMDNQGIMHFTDTPLPGSTPVNLADDTLTGDNPPPPPSPPPVAASAEPSIDSPNLDEIKKAMSKAKATAESTGAPAEAKPSKAGGSHYKSLVITQPKNEATYFNNRGEVDLSIEVKPNFREEDKAVVLIDGKAFATKRDGLLLQVQDVARGKHTTQVQIQDKAGQVLMVSNEVTFYMHRTSVNSPANPASTALTPPVTPLSPPPPAPLTPARTRNL